MAMGGPPALFTATGNLLAVLVVSSEGGVDKVDAQLARSIQHGERFYARASAPPLAANAPKLRSLFRSAPEPYGQAPGIS